MTTTTTTKADAGPVAQIETRTFTEAQFSDVMRTANLIGAYSLWRQLERIAEPEPKTRERGEGILRASAESRFCDCQGVAFSPQSRALRNRLLGQIPSLFELV